MLTMNIKNVDFGAMASRYKEELLGNVLPFWLEHSQDTKFGGYYTCLNRDGSVYDKDKFIWLQGREVWMFAMLYNKLAKNEEWLKCAEQGARFLMKYGHTPDYDFYFSLTREGKPVIQPYNIFSNTFACMGFTQLAEATREITKLRGEVELVAPGTLPNDGKVIEDARSYK